MQEISRCNRWQGIWLATSWDLGHVGKVLFQFLTFWGFRNRKDSSLSLLLHVLIALKQKTVGWNWLFSLLRFLKCLCILSCFIYTDFRQTVMPVNAYWMIRYVLKPLSKALTKPHCYLNVQMQKNVWEAPMILWMFILFELLKISKIYFGWCRVPRLTQTLTSDLMQKRFISGRVLNLIALLGLQGSYCWMNLAGFSMCQSCHKTQYFFLHNVS